MITEPGWTNHRKITGTGRIIQNVVNLQNRDSATSYSKYAVPTILSYFGFVCKPRPAACAYSSNFLTNRGQVFGKKTHKTNWIEQWRRSGMQKYWALQAMRHVLNEFGLQPLQPVLHSLIAHPDWDFARKNVRQIVRKLVAAAKFASLNLHILA